jgi:hypothetical protein
VQRSYSFQLWKPNVTGAIQLSFKAYIEAMAIAIGGLSVGRGILANAKATADSS